MKNIFDYNAQANEALLQGGAATRASGMPTQAALPGTLAPGGSNETGEAILARMRQKTQSLLDPVEPQQVRDPILGYNPNTGQVFSGGKVFALDLNEGRQNAPLLDVHNEQLPEGFLPLESSQAKAKLQRDYDGLDIVDDFQRRFGQAASNYGSTIEDLGAESLGRAMQQYGGDIAARNPSKITTAKDIVDKPMTLIGETVGELAYDLPVALGTTAAAVTATAPIGLALAPMTGGASIPLVAILSGLGSRFLTTMLETYGSVRSEQRAKGIYDPTAAATSGLGSSALEALVGPEARIGAQLAKKSAQAAGRQYATKKGTSELLAPNAAKNARDLLKENAFKYGGKKALQDFATEGGTEIAQSAMERAGAYNDLTSPEAFDEYAISGVKGGIGGAMISPLSTMAEFQDAKSFMESLKADMADAANTALPSAQRIQAAKRVQDVLRGSSSDAEFNAQLQEFRGLLAEVDRKITEDATKQALADGSPVNLMDAAPQQDLFNRGMDEGANAQGEQATTQLQNMVARVMQEEAEKEDGETQVTAEILRRAEERLRAEAAAGAPQPQQDYSGQISLFDETDAPTYQADPSFGVSQFEAQQAFQGPTLDTPAARFGVAARQMNSALDLEGIGGFPEVPTRQPVTNDPNSPLTGDLGPLQTETLQGPTRGPRPISDVLSPLQRASLSRPASPIVGGVDMSGLSLDIGGAAAPVSAPNPAVETAAFGRPLRTVSPTVDGRTDLTPPAAPAAGGAFSQQAAQDLGLDNLESSVAGQVGTVPPMQGTIGQTEAINITSGLLSSGGKVQGRSTPKAQSTSDALRTFAIAWWKFTNSGTNLNRPTKPVKGGTTAQANAEQSLRTHLRYKDEAEQALTALGELVGYNAKDLQTLIATSKKQVQAILSNVDFNALSKEDQAIVQAMQKIDVNLSSGWAAAKTDIFRGGYDIFMSKSNDTRQASEMKATGKKLQFRKAAEEGYGNIAGNAELEYTGFFGILQYIRFNGSTYDKVLARAIRETMIKVDESSLSREENIAARRERMNAPDIPRVQFITEGNPRFDPNTNTIYIREDDSPSTVLHEALHGALQSFVYNNPDHPNVKALKQSLKAVISYKGALGERASKVRDILRGMVEKGNELDAVLELISYGNTLNDFRKAMEAMPTKGTPKSFLQMVNDVWNNVLALVRQLTGLKGNTEAGNVINRTFELLAEAGMTPVAEDVRPKGNVLEAAVRADDPMDGPQKQLLKRPGTELPSSADISRFNKTLLPKYLNTKVLFDLVGWNKAESFIGKFAEASADWVRRNFPALAGALTYIHAHFNTPHLLRATFQEYKNNKHAGYRMAERLATSIEKLPTDKVSEIFRYLDGDQNALKDDDAMREVADDVRKWRDYYVQELGDDKAKAFFAGGKFSETLLFPTSREKVASDSLGVRGMSRLIGLHKRSEKNLQTDWLATDASGDYMLDNRKFMQVFEDKNGKRVPAGFIDQEVFAKNGAPVGTTVDNLHNWVFDKYVNGEYRFEAHTTAAQVIRANKADQLANALRNTMAALGNSFASKTFTDSVASYGVEEGKRTATSVAFSSIEEAEKVLGIKINPDTVITANSETNRTQAVSHQYRSPSLWVRIPKGARYGALAGMVMKSSVWSAMQDTSNRSPYVSNQVASGAMRWFKQAKTVYNPSTHMTNVATNVSIAIMHDLSFGTMAQAGKLFAMYHAAPNSMSQADRSLVRAFLNSSAMLGDYSSTEVKQALSQALLNAAKEAEGNKSFLTGVFGKVAQMSLYEKHKSKIATTAKGGKAVHDFANGLYAAEDNVFRLALFLKSAAEVAAHKGESVPSQATFDTAGNMARDGFLDYDIDAYAVKATRASVLPFVSWPYAMAGMLGKMAVHKPWAIVNLMLAYTVMEHIMQEISGGDDEDERLRKTGPEHLRERAFGGIGPYTSVRIPFMGDDQNPVYYKLGDYNPVFALGRVVGEGKPSFMGQSWIPSALQPGGPWISGLMIGLAGIDPWTGKTLSSTTATNLEKLGARLQALQGQFSPNLPFVNLNEWDKFVETQKGRLDRSDNAAALQWARWAGFKVYDYNVDQAKIQQSRAARAIMGQYKAEISKLRRAEARYERPDWDAFREKQAELLVRMQEATAKARGEA